MLKNIAYWFSFLATAFLFETYSGNIASLIRHADQLQNPFYSTSRAIHYSWSVLPLILEFLAYPLLVRRVSLVIANRYFAPQKYGVLATSFLVLFVLLALVIYGPRFIAGLGQLAFGAGFFKLWLPIPILLAYISSEIGSIKQFPSSPAPSNAANLSILAPITQVRHILLLSGFLTVIAYVAVYVVSPSLLTGYGLGGYSLFTMAILSAAGAYICFSLGQRSPRFQCSPTSIVLGAVLFTVALGQFSLLLSKIYSPLIRAIVYSHQTFLLLPMRFVVMFASLVLTIVLASAIFGISASAINSLTNHSRGTR